jgi:hypothetical protein
MAVWGCYRLELELTNASLKREGNQTSRPAASQILPIQEAFMEQRATGTPAVNMSNPQSSGAVKSPRSIWVLTAYGVSGLALLGVLAYYFSSYLAQ